MGMHSPIEQFEVHDMSGTLFDLGGHAITFSNFALGTILTIICGFLLMYLPTRKRSVVPGRWQALAEMLHGAIESSLIEAAGPKAKPFLPYIFSIFMFILMGNFLGLVPGLYTVTSQVVANLCLSLSVIGVVLIVGFMKHGLHFFHIFLPSGVPGFLAPIIFPIEMVSFFIRPFSLALRLFANMLAGHILLKVFAGMTAAIATAGWVGAIGVLPLILNVAIVGFEVFVALLQAYIFTVLSSVYLRDALEMH
ncbi:MAG: F0F1 ATP synthase subunit A [Alphaproteobacteria bacterium]|nr:F0F1 ATP synthase subunit A [Alphaproteobacteria bacterium]